MHSGSNFFLENIRPTRQGAKQDNLSIIPKTGIWKFWEFHIINLPSKYHYVNVKLIGILGNLKFLDSDSYS